MLKSDLRIVSLRFRGRQKDDFALRMQPALSELNQPPANPLLLAGGIHRQIRKITAVTEIRHRPRHSHQKIAIPSRANEIGIIKHRRNSPNIIHRAPLRQSGPLQDINELLRCDLAVVEIINRHEVFISSFCQFSRLLVFKERRACWQPVESVGDDVRSLLFFENRMKLETPHVAFYHLQLFNP